MRSVSVRQDHGSPALYVDGVKTLPILYGLSDIPGSRTNTAQAQKNIRQFAEQGIHLVTADTELRLGWHKVSPFEWEPLQEEIAGAMQADPQTRVLLRLHVNPPYWWMRDNPDEMVIYKDQPGLDDGETQRLIRDDHLHRMRVSLASEKWLHDAGECLKQFCRQVWNTAEGEAVLGIQVACGVNGEWHQWGCDCSKPMKTRFHRLLREKYGTDEALQAAWGDPTVTLDDAPFNPDTEQPGDDGIFRDPVRSRRIMDAQECVQISVTDAILYFCKIVKENWGRPVLAGTFYGYYLGTGGDGMPIGGHLFPDKLYEAREYVDFLCGPFPYMENRRPDGVPMSRALIESNRLRGMLWLTEMDQHPAGTADYIGGDPNRMDETIAQLRRNTLLPLLAGEGLWFYDHRLIPRFVGPDSHNPYAGSIYRKTGWWDNPTLLKEIHSLYELAQRHLLGAYRPAADVLVVYNPQVHYAFSRFIDDDYHQHEAFSRSGAAYDCIYLNELEIAQMERYRCVIFPNAYRLTPEQRDMIRRRTQGKQVVWLYAAGFSDDKTLSEDNIRDLTGISVRRTENAYAYRTLAPLPEAEVTYRRTDFTPLFAVDDPEAQPLARYADGSCAAARKGDTWYFALPRLNADILRYILREAGAHIYCDAGDPIIAGAGVVAINSFAGGHREVILRDGRRVELDLPPLTTHIIEE